MNHPEAYKLSCLIIMEHLRCKVKPWCSCSRFTINLYIFNNNNCIIIICNFLILIAAIRYVIGWNQVERCGRQMYQRSLPALTFVLLEPWRQCCDQRWSPAAQQHHQHHPKQELSQWRRTRYKATCSTGCIQTTCLVGFLCHLTHDFRYFLTSPIKIL